MMESINILYIDDNNDEALSRYLNEQYCSREFEYTLNSQKFKLTKGYQEIKYESKYGYKSLLKDSKVVDADVILIDNRLFEENTVVDKKFSGTMFSVILKKLYPYKEVIVITQDRNMNGYNFIHKYDGKECLDAENYYDNNLKPVLDNALKVIIEVNQIIADIKEKETVDKFLADKLDNTLKGDNSYDELSKEDIDELIATFKEFKNAYRK